MFARTPRTPFRQDFKDNTGLSIIDTWTTNFKEQGNSLRLASNHGIPSIQSIILFITYISYFQKGTRWTRI